MLYLFPLAGPQARVRTVVFGLLFLLLWPCHLCSADLVIPSMGYKYPFFPARAKTNKLQGSSLVPFGTNWNGTKWLGSRFQQVYNASLFTNLPAGGMFIGWMWVRPGCGGDDSSSITNLVIRMSTTPKSAGTLSPVFDENLGADVTNVHVYLGASIDGYMRSFICDFPSSSGALAPLSSIFFLSSYFYDPMKGNLLVEMLIPDHVPGRADSPQPGQLLRAEVSDGLQDGMSCIEARGTNAVRASKSYPFGLVTRFLMVGLPKLWALPDGDQIALVWPAVPNPLRLQYKDDLQADTLWMDHDVTGVLSDPFKLLRIPKSSIPARRYYRLYWNSPQPGIPGNGLELNPSFKIPNSTP